MPAAEGGGTLDRLPTVDDVARRAGVSRQTVSNVLNAPGIVRPETRARVEGVIAELGYRPHAAARRLRTRASSAIAVRLDPIDNGISGSVLDRFLHALTERADARGMHVTLFVAADVEAEIAQYRRMRDAAEADAVVVTATGFDDPRIEWLASEGFPFVAFGRPWGAARPDDPARPWVDVDGREGTRQATRHLVSRGLRRIGFLGWRAGSGTGDDRHAGWRDVLRDELGADEAELEARAIRIDDGVPTARIAVEEALRAGSDLEGLVCASDSLALGAMMAVREAGRPRFPVIGFDNTPVAQAVGLSSVDQRLGDVATATLELLMGPAGRRVLSPGAADGPRNRLVVPQLVVRRSSHLAPVEDAGGTRSGNRNGEKEDR